MDYENIADLNDLTPEQYDEFVDWLKERTSKDLRAAKGNADQIRAAIERYLKRCAHSQITRGEYTDFFRVDDPSILDLAGYSDAEAAQATTLFDEVSAAPQNS
jgi:hypothetical protein